MFSHPELESLERCLPNHGREAGEASFSDIVVVASSSRGGSSFFAEVLRNHPDLLHFPAEINPYLMVARLGFPLNGSDSDALGAEHAADADSLRKMLLSEAGNYVTGGLPEDWGSCFSGDLYARLSLQWPDVQFSRDEIKQAFQLAVDAAGGVENGFPTQDFHARFLCALRGNHPEINPYYYDINRELIRELAPELPAPGGPPTERLLEEVPFVTIAPWDRHGALSRPLIIKTPSNCYRLEFLKALFPQARFRVLHLTRNPLSSVNGLCRGWMHHGFFSHRVEERLDIEGYSETGPWGRHWWNFDLPPGWREWTQRPLADVCGFQWSSAHQATLDFLERHPEVERITIRFEDLIRDEASRRGTLARALDWLGVDLAPLETIASNGLPPVMQTDRPSKGRWKRHVDKLKPVMENQRVWRTAERLGYQKDDEANWI